MQEIKSLKRLRTEQLEWSHNNIKYTTMLDKKDSIIGQLKSITKTGFLISSKGNDLRNIRGLSPYLDFYTRVTGAAQSYMLFFIWGIW